VDRLVDEIFWMPLHGDQERAGRVLDGFDDAVAGTGGDEQTRGGTVNGLVVAGVDGTVEATGDRGEAAARLDGDVMGFAMVRDVPVQRTTQVDVQNLETATDAQNGQVKAERLRDQRVLKSVAVRMFAKVRPSGENQTGQTTEGAARLVRCDVDGFETDGTKGCLVGRSFLRELPG
jgi:hypothetical protein